MFEKGSNPSEEISTSQIQYIFTDPGCGDNTETHTVREWFGAFGMTLEDEFYVKWNQAVMELGIFFREAEKTANEHVLELSWTVTLVLLYLNYETNQEFAPQFEENVKELCALLATAPTNEGTVDR